MPARYPLRDLVVLLFGALVKYQIDYLLYGVDQLLAGWLAGSSGWERAYMDDLAAVWVQRQ